MKVEELIELLRENKEFVKPRDVAFHFKVSEEEGAEILKLADIFEVAKCGLDHVDWKQKTYLKNPDKISSKSINELQELLDKTFPESDKRLFEKWECGSCGTIITKEKKTGKPKCSCGNKTLKKIYEDKEEIKFNYSSLKPNKEITDIKELEKIIKAEFPSIWFETKSCLSAVATLSLKNLNGCPSLNLVGNPSGEKTTILSFFYGQDLIYLSDDFTPKAFVSHSANVGAEDLEKIDLLPKLKNKCLITPELAPLFEAPKDKMIENFSMLTRVLDGEGLNRDSGTHGQRGYSGDYKFVWLGASTPIRASVWNVMGKIGNRLFFLNVRDKNRTDEDYLTMFRGKAYEEKVRKCRGAVINFLNNFFSQNKVRSLNWDAEGDIFILPEIIKYAKFLSKLRGSLMLWKSEEQGKYEYTFPVIEEPPRAINSLYNLAKGHALINGRTYLKKEDLEIVKAVCFSSMPHDRSQFLRLLAKHEGKLTTQQIQKELSCSDETARKTMNIFKILGVVDLKDIEFGYGRPMQYVEIKSEFIELLEHTQVLNDLEKSNPSENRGESDDYDSVKPEDFVKITEKNQDAHLENKLGKSSPRKNNPVLDPNMNSDEITQKIKEYNEEQVK